MKSNGRDRSGCRAQLIIENSLAIEMYHYITPTKWPNRYNMYCANCKKEIFASYIIVFIFLVCKYISLHYINFNIVYYVDFNLCEYKFQRYIHFSLSHFNANFNTFNLIQTINKNVLKIY